MKTGSGVWQTLGVAAMATAMALPAAAQTANPNAKNGGTITLAHIAGPGHFDPAMFCTTVELEPAMHIYESLVMMDEKYAAKPMLASKVDVDPEGKRFTFTLRHGVKFHNGKEMTSADVVATLKRYAKISPNAAVFAKVSSFDAPDPYTVVINLTETSAVLLDVMKTPCYPMSIIPAEEAAKGPRENAPIGTGPFQVGEWVKDSHLILRRFDGYVADTSSPGPDGYAGRKTVHVDSIRYNFMPEVSTRVAALQAGTVDIAAIDPTTMPRLAGNKDVTIAKIFPNCMNALVMMSQNAPTNNVKIRQAVLAAVDVEELAEASGQVYRLNPSLLYADSPYYTGPQMEKYFNIHDPARAKKLLAEAGYKGEKIVILTNSNYAYMRSQMLVLEQQLKAIGMNVELQVTDWITNSARVQRQESGWNISTTGYCSQPLLGPQQWRPLIYNMTALDKAGETDIDAAYAKFFTSLNIEDRKAAWLAAETGIRSKAYLIKLGDAGNVVAYRSSKVKGWKPWYGMRNWDLWVE
jgi:peptide/nickel transport system substrate-binding protein